MQATRTAIATVAAVTFLPCAVRFTDVGATIVAETAVGIVHLAGTEVDGRVVTVVPLAHGRVSG